MVVVMVGHIHGNCQRRRATWTNSNNNNKNNNSSKEPGSVGVSEMMKRQQMSMETVDPLTHAVCFGHGHAHVGIE